MIITTRLKKKSTPFLFSYIEVNQIFGYLAPINHFSVPLSVKNVKQLCDKSHWFPKGKSGFW